MYEHHVATDRRKSYQRVQQWASWVRVVTTAVCFTACDGDGDVHRDADKRDSGMSSHSGAWDSGMGSDAGAWDSGMGSDSGKNDDPEPSRDGQSWQWDSEFQYDSVTHSDDITEPLSLETYLLVEHLVRNEGNIKSFEGIWLLLTPARVEPYGFETAVNLTSPASLPLAPGESTTVALGEVELPLRDRVMTLRNTETASEQPLTTLRYPDDFLGWSLHTRRELVVRRRGHEPYLQEYELYTLDEDGQQFEQTRLPEHLQTFQWLRTPAYFAHNYDTQDETGFLSAFDLEGEPLITLRQQPGSDADGSPIVEVSFADDPSRDHTFTFDRGFAQVHWWQSYFSPNLRRAYVPMNSRELSDDTNRKVAVADLQERTSKLVSEQDAARPEPAYVSHDGAFEAVLPNAQQIWTATLTLTLRTIEEMGTRTELDYEVVLRLELESSFVEVRGALSGLLWYGYSDFD